MVMKAQEEHARLYLNGRAVGRVRVEGQDGSWHFGEFEAGEGFGEFAMAFGRWSLLVHEKGEGGKVPKEVREELRRVEKVIDRMEAKLYFEEKREWREAAQVNIDGGMIEWKEY
jgi:hypothetical protein